MTPARTVARAPSYKLTHSIRTSEAKSGRGRGTYEQGCQPLVPLARTPFLLASGPSTTSGMVTKGVMYSGGLMWGSSGLWLHHLEG
jgi:hypothetical protein